MAGKQRRLVPIYGLLFAAILLFALLPILSVFGSIAVAQIAGCQLDEGSSHPCLVMGADIGGSLTFFFVAGWLAFITVPYGLLALGLWLVTLIFHLLIRYVSRQA